MFNPDFDATKFRQLMLYIADRSKEDPWFGATKLNKTDQNREPSEQQTARRAELTPREPPEIARLQALLDEVSIV